VDGDDGFNEQGVAVHADVMERTAVRQQTGARNISEAERWGSLGAGMGLIAYGISRNRVSGWVLAALGVALVRRGATSHCDVYHMLGVNTARSNTKRALGGPAGVHVDERTIINRPATELYSLWRNLENLPRFMSHLTSVERLTDTLSRWKAEGPAGAPVEWNAEIINEVPNRLIGWRSIEGSDVVSAGSVHFDEVRPGQTRVRVRLQYSPPAGKVGDALARLVGRDAATQIREDLQRFKQMVEDGALR
jgi:uncharacterized membrane protein